MKREISLSDVRLEAQPERSVLEALEKQGIFMPGGCHGAGLCGKCKIRYLTPAPAPTAIERRLFSPRQLRQGFRLACLHRAERACRVEVAFLELPEEKILTVSHMAPLQETAREKTGWCAVVDLGTTTIAMQARNLADGEVLATQTAMNPQRRFGSDVVSRMDAALSGHAKELRRCVQTVLEEGVQKLARQAGPDGLQGIYVAGNTVMAHLLAGLPVDGLSRYPFCPETLSEQRIQIDGHTAFLLPGISAFVGADLLAGVLACGMQRREEISLLIDLGTNGEMVLGNREKLLCTATAAGPAFEGRSDSAAFGTDLIAGIAELLQQGRVDRTGLLGDAWFETGALCREGKIRITQEDIRAVQMAKAAVYAGICVLLREYGIGLSEISAVWLAGGFGYALDADSAAQIGLFPRELTGRVRAVGNTSLEGAYCYGRGQKDQADAVRRISRAVNLAQDPAFEPLYLEHLNF